MKQFACIFSVLLAIGCGGDDDDGGDPPDEITQGPQTLKDFTDGEYAGSSVTLHRHMDGTDDRLEAETTMTGLTEGNVYTFWWIIFNNDEACVSTPNDDGNPRCGLDDFTPAQEEATVQTFAYGFPGPSGGAVAPASGEITFPVREYRVTDTAGGAGLTDVEKSEVHVLIRDHGPELPAGPQRDAQFTEYLGGCMPDNGPNDCAEIAFAIFIDSSIDEGDCTGHICN